MHVRTSVVTWSLTFQSPPNEGERALAHSLLGPIARIETDPEFDLVWRELGQSIYTVVEPEYQLTAGEIALNCLTKAHRLGHGWSLFWPGVPKTNAKGWSMDAFQAAARPESLHELEGGLNSMSATTTLTIPNLYSASFKVRVLP